MNLPYLEEFQITKLYSPNHPGLDLLGTTKEVRAVQTGKIYLSAYDPKAWGNYIVIQQIDGYFSIYCHLKSRYKTAGQAVQAGEWIGDEGKTGNTTTPHLHFEVRKDFHNPHSAVNPGNYLGLNNAQGVAKLAKEQTSSWAKSAQEWVKSKQISDGEHPKNTVTREELWVLLFRLYKHLRQVESDLENFQNELHKNECNKEGTLDKGCD